MSYDGNYPSEPIGGVNPYYRCVKDCKYRIAKEQTRAAIAKHKGTA